MEQQADCNETIVMLGTSWGVVDFPLNEWIAHGPGKDWFIIPFSAKCQDNDHELPVSVIPIEYRNNGLTHLLLAGGIIAYPWNPEVLQVAKINFIKFTKSDFARSRFGIEMRLSNSTDLQEMHLNDLVLNVDKEWTAWLGKVFDTDKIVLSLRNPTIHQLSGVNLWEINGFVATLELLIGGLRSLDVVMAKFIPDKQFAISCGHEKMVINHHEVQYMIADSEKYQCSVLAVLYKVDNLVSDAALKWIEILAVARLGMAQSVLTNLIDMLSQHDIALE